MYAEENYIINYIIYYYIWYEMLIFIEFLQCKQHFIAVSTLGKSILHIDWHFYE